ncbi:MAG TPA: hypothetical protein P5081_10585 [Phycisphaerae bacterium]|nr:hypothetical protein [Phycisphaerae bacterium]HRW53324.1 hypothetical protein [Phycisphaerae bacterium]
MRTGCTLQRISSSLLTVMVLSGCADTGIPPATKSRKVAEVLSFQTTALAMDSGDSDSKGVNYRIAVPVPARAENGGLVYIQPEMGLDIVSIEADGEFLFETPCSIAFDEFPQELLATVPCVADSYVYQLHVGNSGSYSSSTGELEVVSFYSKPNQDIGVQRFLVPTDTRELRIVYRGRYPVGEPGDSIQLVASLKRN